MYCTMLSVLLGFFSGDIICVVVGSSCWVDRLVHGLEVD